MREPRKYMMVLALAGFLLGGIGPTAFAQRVIYVDASATGSDNGRSWEDAYVDLQDALAEAAQPDACTQDTPCEVWVAGGPQVDFPDVGRPGPVVRAEDSDLVVVLLVGRDAPDVPRPAAAAVAHLRARPGPLGPRLPT